MLIEDKIKKILEENIKNLAIIKRKPKTKFYIVGDQTYYNAVHDVDTHYSKKELDELNLISQIPRIVLGRIKYKICQLCGKDLDEIRNVTFPNKPRHVEKFCCKSHMIEYSKRKQIRKQNEATGIAWKTKSGEPVPKSNGMTLHYAGTRKTYRSKELKFKKGKTKKLTKLNEVNLVN